MGLAIVTGASRGLGQVSAKRLCTEGWTVAALARDADALDALAEAHPGVVPVACDLTDPGPALEEALSALFAAHGPCTLLINNAGFGLRAAVEEIPLALWRRQFELNLFATARLAQAVLPGMRAAGEGCIVNVSSVAGRIATPYSGAYAATKFALEAASDALRLEVAPFGISVILVEPGPVATSFLAAAGEASDAILDRAGSPYASGYGVLRAQLDGLHGAAWPSERVVDRMMAAITSSSPPARVVCCDRSLRLALWLRALAPGLLDRLLARRFQG